MLQRTVQVGKHKLVIVAESGSWTLKVFNGSKFVDTLWSRNIPKQDTSSIQKWLSDNGASCLSKGANEAIAELKTKLGEFQ